MKTDGKFIPAIKLSEVNRLEKRMGVRILQGDFLRLSCFHVGRTVESLAVRKRGAIKQHENKKEHQWKPRKKM